MRRAKRESVLLVESDLVLRRSARNVLEECGYTVFDVGDAPQAVNLVAVSDEPVDLLLSDMAMPEMSGPELYEELVKHRPSLRVLYMTGISNSIMQRAMEDAYVFIEKPYDPEELVNSVERVLARD